MSERQKGLTGKPKNDTPSKSDQQNQGETQKRYHLFFEINVDHMFAVQVRKVDHI